MTGAKVKLQHLKGLVKDEMATWTYSYKAFGHQYRENSLRHSFVITNKVSCISQSNICESH